MNRRSFLAGALTGFITFVGLRAVVSQEPPSFDSVANHLEDEHAYKIEGAWNDTFSKWTWTITDVESGDVKTLVVPGSAPYGINKCGYMIMGPSWE